jgi:hypothetical protein
MMATLSAHGSSANETDKQRKHADDANRQAAGDSIITNQQYLSAITSAVRPLGWCQEL